MTKLPNAPAPTAALLELPDDDFRALVDDHLDRRENAPLWELLLSPELARRTRTVLGSCISRVDAQLAEHRAVMDGCKTGAMADDPAAQQHYMATNGEHHEWRRRALGYKRLVTRRLSEAKEAVTADAAKPTPPSPRRVRQMTTIFRLAWVIHEHRTAMLDQGIAPDEHDVDLWRALDLIEVDTPDGPINVTDFLDGLMDSPTWTPPTGPAGDR